MLKLWQDISDEEWNTHSELRLLKESGIRELIKGMMDDLAGSGIRVLPAPGPVIEKNGELGFTAIIPGLEFSVSARANTTAKLLVTNSPDEEVVKALHDKLGITLTEVKNFTSHGQYRQIVGFSDKRRRQSPEAVVGELIRINKVFRRSPGPTVTSVRKSERVESRNGSGGRPPRQPDHFLRTQVEVAAMIAVTREFEGQGYVVHDRSSENLGWDLEAIRGSQVLKLEVKGLSGRDINIELTPNEFMQMKKHRTSYRLCVVANALIDPRPAVFAYLAKSGLWQDDQGRSLDIVERIAARCTAKGTR